jgi:hypothetical protein
MGLGEQWQAIEKGLDPRWSNARLVLAIDDDSKRKRAAALLAPASSTQCAAVPVSDPKRCGG